MKKNKISILICLMLSSSVFLSAAKENVTISTDKTYVMFNGFDFEGYKPEDGSCVDILKAEYDEIKNDPIANKDFVLVGHSQGGLRALAFATYVKNKDTALYNHIKGVITLSGIDQGLTLLEDNGSQFRWRFFDDVGILNRGVLGCVAVIPGVDNFCNSLQYFTSIYDLGTSAIGYGIATAVLEIVPETKSFCTPVLSGNWDKYAQMRDMCPQSDFIKEYVIDKTYTPKRIQTGSHISITVVWRSKKVGWVRIHYPVVITRSIPEYTYVMKLTNTDVKIDETKNVAFLVGANNDTMSILEDESLRKGIDNGMKGCSVAFRAGQVAHIAKCARVLGFFTNSVKYASDCSKAASWTWNYKDELNDLKGSDENDGLVACSDQFLPATSFTKAYIKNEYSSLNHATINENATVENTYKALIADWTTQ